MRIHANFLLEMESHENHYRLSVARLVGARGFLFVVAAAFHMNVRYYHVPTQSFEMLMRSTPVSKIQQ